MDTQKTPTPTSLIIAIEKTLKIKFKYDMAAGPDNTKCDVYFTEQDNSLKIDWPIDDWCWLNPPFRNLTKWIKKCEKEKGRGARIVSIWPLSGDINQIDVWRDNTVFVLHGRVWPLVRGCMIVVWNKNSIFNNALGYRWDGTSLKKEWRKI